MDGIAPLSLAASFSWMRWRLARMRSSLSLESTDGSSRPSILALALWPGPHSLPRLPALLLYCPDDDPLPSFSCLPPNQGAPKYKRPVRQPRRCCYARPAQAHTTSSSRVRPKPQGRWWGAVRNKTAFIKKWVFGNPPLAEFRERARGEQGSRTSFTSTGGKRIAWLRSLPPAFLEQRQQLQAPLQT